MKWVILFLSLMVSPATAQAVVVKSGDHADFTRLVLTFPESADWQLGRTADGYELAWGTRNETYDLTEVYRLITKARLKSIWSDPETRYLKLGVGCSCYAIPFELDSNTLVIDIKDGSPPTGSAFEQRLIGGEAMAPLTSKADAAPPPLPVPASASYDWLAEEGAVADANARAITPVTVPPDLKAAVEGDGFRNAVIDQLAKGATEGIVEIVPIGLAERSDALDENVEDMRLGLEDLSDPSLGVSVSDGTPQTALTEAGDLCPTEARVNLTSWSPMESDATSLFAARSAILGEFDEPNPEELQNAINTLLFFGFGAEARNFLHIFQSEERIDQLSIGLSYLVDGEVSPNRPFSGMQTCNSAAAFWALAEASDGHFAPGLNGNAVARTYLGLPQHLKMVFAQSITHRLLQAGDAENAEIVRSALIRSAPLDSAIVPLVKATMALANRKPEEAEIYLETVTESAVAAEALLALVEARFQQRRAMDEKDVLALEAFAFTRSGSTDDTAFKTALTHAMALSGDFSKAFMLADHDIALRADTWELLATLGKESDVLLFVAGGALRAEDRISTPTRSIFVRRLLDLGLPNAAIDWLPQSPPDTTLAAEVFLANKDGRAALRSLASNLAEADPKVLSEALRETGDFIQAASVLRDENDAEGARRLERWGGVWTSEPVITPATDLSTEQVNANMDITPDIWDEVSALRKTMPEAENSPQLEGGQKNLDDSVKTRDLIAELLSAVPPLP